MKGRKEAGEGGRMNEKKGKGVGKGKRVEAKDTDNTKRIGRRGEGLAVE